jgi:hypothetical protein
VLLMEWERGDWGRTNTLEMLGFILQPNLRLRVWGVGDGSVRYPTE